MGKGGSHNIHFHYLSKPFYFPDRRLLKDFLSEQLQAYKKKVDTINYIFCNDEYLLNINQTHLQHNTYTDIITFELSQKDEPLLADVFISIERVKENAFIFQTSFSKELHRVIFHGVLHLIGFNDKNTQKAKRMRREEELWLSQYFVSRDTVSSRNIFTQ